MQNANSLKKKVIKTKLCSCKKLIYFKIKLFQTNTFSEQIVTIFRNIFNFDYTAVECNNKAQTQYAL